MYEKWMEAPRHLLVEQAKLSGSDELAFVGLMAGSCVSVWAAAGGIWYLSQKKKEEERAESERLVADDNAGDTETAGGALGVSSLSVLFSIPALFAHWCWPVVIGAVLGGAAEFFTPKARAIGHALFWGLNFGLFVVVSAYMVMKAKQDEQNLALKWGPFTLVTLGALLVMVDLTRHVVLDLGLAGEELAMYTDKGDLSEVGVIGVVCTWVGVIFVASGIAWFANLPAKVLKALGQ